MNDEHAGDGQGGKADPSLLQYASPAQRRPAHWSEWIVFIVLSLVIVGFCAAILMLVNFGPYR